jgi:hypothetical protein
MSIRRSNVRTPVPPYMSWCHLSDDRVQKICASILGMKKFNLAFCGSLTDQIFECLKRLSSLEELNLERIFSFSVLASYDFFQATKSRLKNFHGSGMSLFVFRTFLDSSPPRVLDLASSGQDAQLKYADVSSLIEVLGKEGCLEVEEMKFAATQITAASLNLIAEKFTSLTKIDVRKCRRISASEISNFKVKLPNCEVLSDK